MKKYKWAFLYLLLVFIPACIYYSLWLISADSFIVNRELNVSPFSDAFDYLWENEIVAFNDTKTLESLASEIDQALAVAEEIEKQSDAITEEIAGINVHRDNLIELQGNEISEKIDEYENKEYERFWIAEQRILNAIAQQEELLGNTINSIEEYEEVVVGLADLRLEYAINNSDFADKRLEVTSYVVSNYTNFATDDTNRKLRDLYENDANLTNKLSDLHGEIRDVRVQIGEVVSDIHTMRKNRLDFLDFLYFSVGISTTTTFGDIVANGKVVRAVVVAQLFSCVFVISGFIRAVLSSSKK